MVINMEGKVKNSRLFVFLAILLIVILAMFVYFIISYAKMDKNVYEVDVGSVLYTDSLKYIKTTGNAKIEEKLDGNYYLYETVGADTNRYKLGKTTFVAKENDSYLRLYGDIYQILNTGSVKHLVKENKVPKSAPTKLFKLDDRKYLMVDTNIKSKDDTVIDARGFLYIEIDKNGNASFANSDLSFKTINPIVLTGAQFNFDIANEELTYDKTKIDLKTVIGSSNEYEEVENTTIYDSEEKKEEEKATSTSSSSTSSSSTTKKTTKKKKKVVTEPETVVEMDVGYYDDYLNSIITSVNNLVVSLKNANETSSKLISQKTVFYDFNKWVALKSVGATSSTIDITYSVFDPNSEYDVVFIKLYKSGSDTGKTYYLNKNSTSFSIGDLTPDSEYNLKFGYKTNDATGETIEDEVTICTTVADYDLQITKITTDNLLEDNTTQLSIHYRLKVDLNYKFKTAKLVFTSDGTELGSVVLSNTAPKSSDESDQGSKVLIAEDIGKDGIYNGVLKLQKGRTLATGNSVNILKLQDVEVCKRDSTNSCEEDLNLKVEYIFYNE